MAIDELKDLICKLALDIDYILDWLLRFNYVLLNAMTSIIAKFDFMFDACLKYWEIIMHKPTIIEESYE